MITISRLNSIFEEEVSKAAKAGLPLPSEVYNLKPTVSRARSFFGQCCSNGRGKITEIKISKYLLEYDTDTKLRETIAHELCHTINPKDGHGIVFYKYAHILNKAYGYHISRTATEEESKEFRQAANYTEPVKLYKVRCTGCGQLIERSRMSKLIRYPHSYSCGICHHDFERVV